MKQDRNKTFGFTRLKKPEKDASYATVQFFNRSPVEIKEKRGFKSFKGVLRNYLVGRALDDIDEH